MRNAEAGRVEVTLTPRAGGLVLASSVIVMGHYSEAARIPVPVPAPAVASKKRKKGELAAPAALHRIVTMFLIGC